MKRLSILTICSLLLLMGLPVISVAQNQQGWQGYAVYSAGAPNQPHKKQSRSQRWKRHIKNGAHRISHDARAVWHRPLARRTISGTAIGVGVGAITGASLLPAAVVGAAGGVGYHLIKKHHVVQRIEGKLNPAPSPTQPLGGASVAP